MITRNFHLVGENIQKTACAAGRDPDSIRLVVVTKGHSIPVLQEVVQAGARWLGENYVDEAISKIAALQEFVDLEWHMIGHVQSRKAKAVCQHFSILHSLDSVKLARRLDRFAAEQSKILPVLLECNVSGEESKFGWPAWDETRWDELLPEIREIIVLPNLLVRGLMTMAPYADDPEQSRPNFQRLRHLAEYFRLYLSAGSWRELSMGMSGDYQVAIQEGATILRIGTAILGPRPCAVDFQRKI